MSLSYRNVCMHIGTVNSEFFANSVKTHIFDAKNSRLGHGVRILSKRQSDFGSS